MPVQFQVVVFAFIAAFVLFQLYNVLGKRVGRQPQEDAKIAPPGPAQADTPKVAAIDPARFLDGARQAYETIVRGYAAGDRAALKPLLKPNVFASFEAGIAARETRGETETVEFLYPPRADLEGAVAEGDKAVAKVRFLAELRSRVTKASGETADATTGEPLVEERRTAEHWTFERTLGATDPNWVLARVEPANA